MIKPGVLLLNLGSPDAPTPEAVGEYLSEFLGDERVIDVPFVRKVIMPLFVVPFRKKQSAEAYSEVWTDEGSPLVVTSRTQQTLLAEATGLPVELAMRYGKPDADSAVNNLKAEGVTHVFIMPMYPHYAMSSYETAEVDAMRAIRKHAPQMQTELLLPFYKDEDYIETLVERSRPWLKKDDWDRLQFSFHGIPVRHLTKRDPSQAHCNTPGCCERQHPAHATCYRHQCMETVRAFVEKANIPRERYGVSFQSRLGKDPWLEPFTDRTLSELPSQGIKRLLIICPAFVTDCLETIEEIAVEGRDIFMEAGGEAFELIPCLNEYSGWIDVMTGRVRQWQETLQENEKVLQG